MRIAVCDDNLNDRTLTGKYIEEYARKRYYFTEIDYYDGGEELLKHFSPDDYAIIFLDIYMNGISGIKTAEKIRATGCESIIILSTISTDHALEGYGVKALSYVVKPIDYKKIASALDMCKSEFLKNSSYIEVMSNKQHIKILLKDIYFIEVYGKTSIIHTEKDQIKTYMPLEEIEKRLGGEPFIRCHRSYIANMDYISDMDDSDFVLQNGSKVPIRKAGKAEAKIALAKYKVQ